MTAAWTHSPNGVYNQTQGSVERPASQMRVTPRLQQVLLVVSDSEDRGCTWKQVAAELGLHHGQSSGALSNLHRMGLVFQLRETRDGCHPYVHAAYRGNYYDNERYDDPVQTRAGKERAALLALAAEVAEWCEWATAYGEVAFQERNLMNAYKKYMEETA